MEKQNKQKKTNNGTSIFKKLLIIILILGMIGMYFILPIMSLGA